MSNNTNSNSFTNPSLESCNNSDRTFLRDAEELIQRIQKADSTDLLELAKIADLNPKIDLAGGNLSQVNLSSADLREFDLSYADLSYANLSHADLSYANLSYADLSHADLSHANLSHANLLSAKLNDADLSDTILEKVQFGENLGLSKPMEIDLVRRGARWEGKIREVLSIWEEFTASDRDWIIAHGDNKFLATGEILIQQGKPIDTVYIVLDGALDVVSMSQSRDRSIAFISATEMVGEMSFVKDLPPSVTVKVKQDTVVWSIPRAELSRKLKQDSEFGYRFYQAIAAVLAYRLKETTLSLLNTESVDNALDSSSYKDMSISGEQRRKVQSGRAKIALGGIASVEELVFH